MCEFCDYYHSSKGGVSGKEIKIQKCAEETHLTDCQVYKGENDNNYSIIIFSKGKGEGYFDINYCPICGSELKGD